MKWLQSARHWLVCTGLSVVLGVTAGCSQPIPFSTTAAPAWPPPDFAFVDDGLLQLVSQSGVVTTTDLPTAAALPAASKSGELVLYAEAVGDKWQLVELNTVSGITTSLTPLAVLPSQLLFSADDDLALMIVADQLYLIFVPQQRLVRVHEGVEQAVFSASNQRVEYRTNDGRLLSREFAVDGNLTPATNLDTDPFVDLAIPERANQVMAGWSNHDLGVYSVDTGGNVTLIQFDDTH